jgi:hypothetical protein
MSFEPKALIEIIRAEALMMVDKRAYRAAEAIRPAHLAYMDAERLREAREAAQTSPQYCTAEIFPVLASIPGDESIHEKALMVVETSRQTDQQRIALESARLAAKAAIRAAKTIRDIHSVTLLDEHYA